MDRLWGPGSNSPAVSPNFGRVQPRRMNILANGQIVTTIVETNWNTEFSLGNGFVMQIMLVQMGRWTYWIYCHGGLNCRLVPFTPTLLTDVVTISTRTQSVWQSRICN